MQKNKNILSIILILLVNSSILIFADPPNWDENGDGVIDNYSFYENNGSITSKVYNNDEDVGTLGDMVGAFVNGGLRGVGIASEIPSFLGSGYAFLSMIYSNATSGETITFQYYSQSDDEIYYLLETEEFVSNMIIGDVTNPFYLSYTTNSDIVDPPDWDADNDGVLDNYSDYENNGSITASIIVDNINYIDEGDMIAAFVNGEQRGVGVPTEVPFGPYTGTYQFQMMIYSNQTSGESLNFQFYDSSEGSIYYLLETLEFVTNMIIGDVINPYIFTFNEGDSNDIYGCMDMSACNYNENATTNDGSCEFPEPNYNCNGECIVDFDCLGICGGTANTDLCGICEGDNTSCVGCTDQNACNYDPNALFDNNNCEYPDENFDCFGNCIVEIDCLGQCGGNAEFDCNDVCSGDAFIDVCGNCVGGDTQNEPCSQDCNGDWGGSAFIDNCYNCVDGNTGLNACENYDYSLDLHVGYNLISTYALPVDSNFDFILNNDVNPDDYIYMIIGESSSSYNTGSNIWVGDLHQGFVEQDKGYWIGTNNTMILNINNSYDINNDISYNLHEGANLVSFPENGIFNLEDAIPDDFEDGFNAILGESLIAIRLADGQWIGSLEYFEGGKGYWFLLNQDMIFNYNVSNNLSRNLPNLNKDKLHNQSYLQSFYFIENINELSLAEGDWILAYNNSTLVGSRKYSGNINDVPVMGSTSDSFSIEYCDYQDIPSFKILKESGEIINLYGEIPAWKNLGLNYINLYENDVELTTDFNISNIYPNPFNPVINFQIDIGYSQDIDLYIIDLNGRKIDFIFNGYIEEGAHSYIWNATNYSSGIYFLVAESSNATITKKVSLIK